MDSEDLEFAQIAAEVFDLSDQEYAGLLDELVDITEQEEGDAPDYGEWYSLIGEGDEWLEADTWYEVSADYEEFA